MNNCHNLQEINQETATNLCRFYINNGQNMLMLGRKGTGKQLSLDTELPTPTGFVQLKDLKEGDILFDENGNETKVLQLHPINYSPEAYILTFDDGTVVEACADHLWLTWDKGARKSEGEAIRRDKERIKPREIGWRDQRYKKILPKIRTTKQIFETLKAKTSIMETNHSISCAQSIKYSIKEQIIDPYLLGCWLGDGHSDKGTIECADEDILNNIKMAGYSITQTSYKTSSKSNSYRIGDLIDSNTRGVKIGLLKKQLQELNLLNNKHIPDNYLYASIEQRMSLLQGLMDTDGTCLKTGQCEYTSTLPILAQQVHQLILSLGIKATMRKNEAWLYDKRCADRYRIHFITEKPVFKLQRKLERLPIGKTQKNRNTHRYIVNVEPIPSKPMRCITVDSPSHLFLITRSFIATHNTAIAMQSIEAAGYKINYINLSVLERNDIAGYPNLFDKGDTITFKAPFFLPYLKDNQKPDRVLLFDEVDKAAPEVMAPLLEISQFKTVNGKRLNAVACIFTGNLMEEGAYSNMINTALLDRCAKFILSFDFNVWLEWAKNNIHPLIIAFLNSNQDLAVGPIETTELATPSPRSWHLSSDALIQAHKNKITDIDTITNIIAGFVGVQASLKFESWYRYSRVFEKYIIDLLENGSCEKDIRTLETTEQLVFTIMTCYHAKTKILKSTGKKKNRYLDNLCRFMIDQEVPREIQLVSLNSCFPFEFIAQNRLYESKSFYSIVSDLRDEVIKND